MFFWWLFNIDSFLPSFYQYETRIPRILRENYHNFNIILVILIKIRSQRQGRFYFAILTQNQYY